MGTKSLSEAVAENPYADFSLWWSMGLEFLTFMTQAIGAEWRAATSTLGDLAAVQEDLAIYSELVYQRVARSTLAVDFIEGRALDTIQSGEFDALSYAFYKSAFETFAATIAAEHAVKDARHAFTQRVGRIFYQQMHEHLALTLPSQLQNEVDFAQLKHAIAQVGKFLQEQGYLRDHFAFHFDVNLQHGEQKILQQPADFIGRLRQKQVGYALYEMGYPAILPSAVYLYQTMGEAQHHSSRTIEELFGRIGCIASETPDFDPTGYSSDRVVELWEIRSP